MADAPEPSIIFEKAIAEHLRVIEAMHAQAPILQRIAEEMTRAVLHGGKVLWCGNGGSAADAQHMAAEFVGRFRRERKGLASIALTTDTSILTAVGNDYGYEQIFRRQVEALCAPGDMVVGISTSGNSRNVCLALQEAKKLGACTVAFTGQGGGAMAGMADAAICVPSKDTARIQEAHILCGHMLCDWVEAMVCSLETEKDAVTR
ncbi:MAG TPA: D-sedoheptulose 7-phosphate isomerase [Acidobacteriaceae bacterium]|nr:D-sedoheptulose 7-phosphate isomerase [Acidobacteriaceae bacterium]